MLTANHQRVTGLSGNDIFCLNKLKMNPGQLCVGNSVVSIGVLGGLGAGLSTLGGGEVSQITQLVYQGRANAFNRMLEEAKRYGGVGLTGITFDLINHSGVLEFIALGSTVHQHEGAEPVRFTSAASAQQLYCQIDAGFQPRGFVFGNVAYSIGVGGGFFGALKSLRRGEVPEFSKIFDDTRHLALRRIVGEAKKSHANAVTGIQITISPLMGSQEMVLVGTAAHHPLLDGYLDNPVTSDMTSEEMWNMANLGYLPIQLVMGVSVYSLGLKGGILSTLKSLGGGEIQGLTELLYEAREKALERIEKDAERCGADDVIGVKTRVYDIGGGMVEFMAIGTAVKKISGAGTTTANLIPQAIIQDRETFVDSTQGSVINLQGNRMASSARLQKGPLTIVVTVLIIAFYILTFFIKHL